MQQTLTVTVALVIESVLTFAPTALPNGVVGSAYPATAIGAVSGGIGPYTFTATGGLPPGMSLSASGVLSGTPTAAGSYSVAVTITDAGAP